MQEMGLLISGLLCGGLLIGSFLAHSLKGRIVDFSQLSSKLVKCRWNLAMKTSFLQMEYSGEMLSLQMQYTDEMLSLQIIYRSKIYH